LRDIENTDVDKRCDVRYTGWYTNREWYYYEESVVRWPLQEL